MSEPITPTSLEETPEIPAPTPNPDPAGGQPAPATAPEAPKPEDTVDFWKNRYSESARENQVNQGKIQEQESRLQSLTTQSPPTDSELRNAYPEWDSMLPHEQRTARENLALKRQQTEQASTIAGLQAERMWDKDLKKVIKKPEYAGIKGREDEFEDFALKPAHRGVSIETLAKSFLFDPHAPVPTPAPTPRPGPERGSGGPKEPPKSKKISLLEAKTLRETNSAEHKRQVEAGNIDLDDI